MAGKSAQGVTRRPEEAPSPGLVTADEWVARVLLEAGVRVVTAFPGATIQGIVERLGRFRWAAEVEVRWVFSPRAAFEEAHGASLAGRKSAACLSGEALGEAYPALVAAARIGCGAGLLVIVGDDPGAWDSFAEMDSRSLLASAGVPTLEPSQLPELGRMIPEGFRLSRLYDVPVALRLCTPLMEEQVPVAGASVIAPGREVSDGKFPTGARLSLPMAASAHQQRLQARLEHLAHVSRLSRFADVVGSGTKGIVAAGYAYAKLANFLGDGPPDSLRVLKLGQVVPLPSYILLEFLLQTDEVLVLEEGEPFVERELRSLLAEVLNRPQVLGRLSGAIPHEGELQSWEIEEALRQLLPGEAVEKPVFPTSGIRRRAMLPAMCPGCWLEPVRQALAIVRLEGDPERRPVVVGDHGCPAFLASAREPLVDVLGAPGSAIHLAIGRALAQPERSVLAITGDYGFLARGLAELADPLVHQLPVTILLVDNGGSAYTGGPRRRLASGVELEDVLGSLNLPLLRVIQDLGTERVRATLAESLKARRLALVVLRFPCMLLEEADADAL